MILGIIGLIILVLGWIPQTISTIKEKHAKINKKFGILYVCGSLILVLYAFQIKDIIFMTLNIIIAIMSGITLYYSIKK